MYTKSFPIPPKYGVVFLDTFTSQYKVYDGKGNWVTEDETTDEVLILELRMAKDAGVRNGL